MYLQCDKQKKSISSAPIQCARNWSEFFRSFLNSPLSTARDIFSNPTAERFEELHPARWRLNPMNIIAGIQNGLEETEGINRGTPLPLGMALAHSPAPLFVPGNYHTSTRHGAHNTIGEAMGRLYHPSVMRSHYNSTLVGRANDQGRFNSESWERFSWTKAKRLFEQEMAPLPVQWVSNRLAGRSKNWVIYEQHNPLGLLGSTPGTTLSLVPPAAPAIGPAALSVGSTNFVKVAVNYIAPVQLPPGAAGPLAPVLAWNGQMFPISSAQIPPIPLAAAPPYNNHIVNIPYGFF